MKYYLILVAALFVYDAASSQGRGRGRGEEMRNERSNRLNRVDANGKKIKVPNTFTVSENDLNTVITKSKNQKLVENDIFSDKDKVVSSGFDASLNLRTITAKISKLQDAFMVLSKNTKEGFFSGGIVDNNNDTLFYRLRKIRGGSYEFVEDTSDIKLVQALGLSTEKVPDVDFSAYAPYTPQERAAKRITDSIAIVDRDAALLLLDFNGTVVVNTYWNASGQPIVCSPAGWYNSADTCDIMEKVMLEDYAFMNVVVTQDSTLYPLARQGRRCKIIYTTSNAWYGPGSGGISYIGSMYYAIECPSFVFGHLFVPANGLNTVTQVGPHEAGHQFGLMHQARYSGNTKTSDYHNGEGTGPTSFAPLMGSAYTRPLGVWWYGSTSNGITYIQDDTKKMAEGILPNDLNIAGPGYSLDAVGNKWQTAKNILRSSPITTAMGRNDSDYYRFTLTQPQSITVTANPLTENINTTDLNANTDVEVALYDNKLNQLTKTANSTGISATISAYTLKAGTYYIRVKVDPLNAYNPYGAISLLGRYTITYSY